MVLAMTNLFQVTRKFQNRQPHRESLQEQPPPESETGSRLFSMEYQLTIERNELLDLDLEPAPLVPPQNRSSFPPYSASCLTNRTAGPTFFMNQISEELAQGSCD